MTGPLIAADTRLDPHLTRRFGCEELHGGHFQHKGDRGGWCSAVMISVPEASRGDIKAGLAWARAKRARVGFTCDTAEQARKIQALARRLLPHHRLLAVMRAAAGAWGPAS
jgi:hypothetical protein